MIKTRIRRYSRNLEERKRRLIDLPAVLNFVRKEKFELKKEKKYAF